MKTQLFKRVNLFLAFAVLFTMVFNLGMPSGAAQAANASDLFISEYIEGSSYNKAVEIYNGTGDSADLSAYSLELYSNGSTIPSQSVTLSGTLDSGDVYVLCNGQAAEGITSKADLTSNSVINFNGDDALALKKNGTVIDTFGQIGTDPGSAWDVNGVSTVNHTLVRKSSVTAGDPDGSDAFDPSAEWEQKAQDDFSNLGSHDMDGYEGGDENQPLSITHTPITEANPNENVQIDFSIQDDDTVSAATVYYKKTSAADFNPSPAADQGSGAYSAAIPASDVTENLEYYIEVSNDNSETARDPGTGTHAITVNTVSGSITIAEARAAAEDTEVTVQGIVTSTGAKVFIQDDTAGINLYGQSDTTAYTIGDLVKATGAIDDYNGLLEIKNYTVEVVSSGNPLPDVQAVTIDQIAEAHEGERVKIENVTIGAIDTGGNTPITDAANHTVNIYKVPALSGISEGDAVDVTAIVSAYNGYQLHVVSAGDITLAGADYITIAEARAAAEDTEVTVQGIVTYAETGTLIYIQDATAGIKIDTYGKNVDLSGYSEGDLVRATGPTDVFQNELEVSVENAADIASISTGNPLPEPAVITIGQIDDCQGQLVKVEMAHITDTTSDNYSFFIEDESGSTKLYYSKASNFTKGDYSVGEYYDIIGIAAVYGSEELKLRDGADMTEREAPQDPDAVLPIIYDLQPANMSSTSDTTPTISAQIEKTESDINTDGIKMLVDGTEVVPQIRTAESVRYTPDAPLALGEHDVKLEVPDTDGQVKTVEWCFAIAEQDGAYHFYFGIPHSHTSYSDGKATPQDAFEHARNNGLDFLFVTDHSNWFDGVTDGQYEYNEETDQYEEAADSEWYNTRIQAEAFNAAHSDFLAMRGFEMTSGDWGHANVINSDSYVEAKKQMTGLDEFYAWVNRQPHSIGAFNHPNWPDDSFRDLAYVPELDRMISLIEVGNGAPPYSYARAEEHYFKALDNGWHVGAINGQDNHSTNWGDPDNLTVIIAKDLTADSFLEAMRNRRTYSTETRSLELTVKADGYWMGSIVDAGAGDTLSFDILAEDSEVPIKELQLISNGGTVIDTKTVGSSASVAWTPEVTLSGGAQWFVVKVIHEDGRWGTASPIFTPAAENDVKLTNLTVEPDTTLPGYETSVETTVTNMGIRDVAGIEVKFYAGSISETNLIGTDTAALLRAGENVTLSTKWIPTVPGSVKIIAKLTEKPGVTTVTEMSTTAVVVAANEKTVLIDGSHNNYEVTGAMLNVIDLLRRYGYTVVVNETSPITASVLTGVDVMIVNTPKTGTYDYTAAEDAVIGQWVQDGGSLLAASTSNYNSDPCTSLNSMLAAAGSTIRFNNDNVYEPEDSDKYNGGMVWSVYSYNVPETECGLNDNMEAIRIFSGCSLVTEENGQFQALTNNPATGLEILLGGNDTSYTALAESDTYVYNEMGQLNGESIPIIAKEDAGQGKVVAAGRHFYSDYEIVNDVSNTALILNIIDYLAGVDRVKTIGEVRANAQDGDIVTVKGTVTAPTDHFFDAMYIQDDTSGVCLYGSQGMDLPLGTEVIATGVVHEFEGEMELAFNNFTYDVLYVGPVDEVTPTALSTIDAMDADYTGTLVSASGLITEYDEDDSYFKIDDGSGEACIHVDGYVGADMSRFGEGDYVKVTGIASIGSAGPRIRVRFYADMEKLDLMGISITAPKTELIKNETVQLTLNGLLSDGTPVSRFAGVQWISSNTDAVTVDQNGLLTGHNKGSAAIAASVAGVESSIMINTTQDDAKKNGTRPVKSISLDSTSRTMYVGDTITLHATVKPSDATNRSVTWASRDTSVVTVDRRGNVKAVSTGSTTVTATAGGKSTTCLITVKPVAVAGISLNRSSAILTVGEATTLVAAVYPNDAADTVAWQSSNAGVASVNSNGRVTAVAEGSAVITATAGGISAACAVTVNPESETSVIMSSTSEVLTVGDTVTLTAAVVPAGTDVTWQSSDNSIATVTPNGSVTAIAPGNVVITATAEGVSASCAVTVNPVPDTTVTLSSTSEILIIGDTVTLTATAEPDAPVVWSSSDETVATVDQDGTVTAVGAGSAVIRATADGVTAVCAITVDPRTMTLTGTLYDKDGNPLAGYTVELHSDPMSTVTDDQGRFTFTGVAIEEHTLTVKNPSGHTLQTFTVSMHNGDDLTWEREDDTDILDMTLSMHEETVEIMDSAVPQGTTKPEGTKSNWIIWVIIAGSVILAGLFIFLVLARKQKRAV